MHKKKLMSRAFAAMMAAAMTVSGFGTGVMATTKVSEDSASKTLFQQFTEPETESGLMARFWFPDAGAGYDKDGDGKGDYIDLVTEQINELIDGGFGGVEMTMLADNHNWWSTGGNEYAKNLGWGTSDWAEILCAALDAANQSDNYFRVDVTIAPHWPMIINNLDPNDDEQQQEVNVADIQKITTDDLDTGTDLTMPAMATVDTGGSNSCMNGTFIRKDTLVSSVVAKVTDVKEVTSQGGWGAPSTTETKYVVDTDNLVDVTDEVTSRFAYKAGVPEGENEAGQTYVYMMLEPQEDGTSEWEYMTLSDLQKQGMDVLSRNVAVDSTGKVRNDLTINEITSMFGSSYTVVDADGNTVSDAQVLASGTTVKYEEKDDGMYYSTDLGDLDMIKITNNDGFGTRERMNDEQDYYNVSGETLRDVVDYADNDETIEVGDYVLINTYRRGTAQVGSGGADILMENKTYAVDYFNAAGAQKVVDYWNENLLPHEYVCADGQTRTLKELFEEADDAYIFEDSIELSHSGMLWSANLNDDFQAIKGYDINTYAGILAGTVLASDEDAESRIEEDYSAVLSNLYANNHLKVVSDWCESFGYGFRTQCHGISAVDADEAALAADIAESDNSTDGFGTRVYAGVVNVDPETKAMSNEALTFGTGFSECPSWYYAVNTLNRYFSEGINRIILHGTPFKRDYVNYDSSWPGWSFSTFMAWNSRDPWWDDVDIISTYISRIQGIMQEGQSKIPVAVLVDPSISNINTINNGVSLSKTVMQEMIGAGFNYNIITKSLVESDLMTTTNDSLSGNVVVSPDAEFQVIVMSDVKQLTVKAMQKLVDFADAGLAIIDLDSDVTEVYGTDVSGNDDATVQALYKELQSKPSYKKISSEDELIDTIASCVDSGVSYDDSASTGSHKWLEATRIYDEKDGSNYYMFYNESAISVGAEQDKSFGPGYWGENGDITATAVLEGNGVPYKLDPADGSVTAISDYEVTEDGIKVNVDIQEGDLFFIVVSDSAEIAAAATPEVAKTTQDTLELGDETWTLKIDSMEADTTDANKEADGTIHDPSQSIVKTIDGIQTKLVAFADLDDEGVITAEQLEYLGVTDSNNISGTAYYTIDVDVPAYDAEGIGAVLNYTFEKQYNYLTNVTVTNADGKTTNIHYNTPNHDYIDLGTVLTPGKNTITIEVATTFYGRLTGGSVPFGPMAENNPFSSGLTDASLTYYTTGRTAAEVTIDNLKAEIEALKAELAKYKAAEAAVKFALKSCKINTVKSLKKVAIVSLKKVSGANGYKVKYSYNKSFKDAKSVYVKGTKAILTKLKSGKTVYVKTKAYKTIAGKKIWTLYSKVKSVKVK